MWENLSTWWVAMTAFERVFWYMAIPSSIFGVLSLISSMFGLGHDSTHDGSFETDHSIDHGHTDTGDSHDHNNDSLLKLLTVKNIIMFFAGTGWMGIIGVDAGWSKTTTTIVALIVGILFTALFALIFRVISRMTESGTITSYESTLGQIGEVYLPIPTQRQGIGQVQMAVAGRIREIDALTDDTENLPTNTKVRVTSIISENILLVTKVL